MVDVGERLRRRRERFALTQEWVAEAIGIPRELLSYWETGARAPNAAHLRNLARVYRTTPQRLRDAEDPARFDATDLLVDAPDTHFARRLEAWQAALDRWAQFVRSDLGRAPPGPARPPAALGERALVYDRRRASSLADRARRGWGLGRAALPELSSFLDAHGILVYRDDLRALGAAGGVAGVFYNHAELGFSLLINERATPARQAFALAHGLAHALFHHSEGGVVCREGADHRLERFADAFAEHLLVPGKELRRHAEALRGASGGEQLTPLDALRLGHVFRVGFPTTVMRLDSERLIAPETAAAWREIDGPALAARVGLEPPASAARRDPGPLRRFPASVLRSVAGALAEGAVRVARAAEVLAVAPQVLARDLLEPPPEPSAVERRAHEELARILAPRD